MSALIELNFFYKNKNIDKYKLSFQKEIQNILANKIIVNIPDKIFKYGKGKHPMKITLFKINSDFIKEYNFNIYYGKNCAYVQLDDLYNNSYEIIMRTTDNPHISYDDMIFNQLDTIENKDKKRLVLINYGSTFLKINNFAIDLSEIIFSNCEFISSSYQLSEIDVKSKKFIVKQFEEYKLDFLINNKNAYNNFGNDLNDLLYTEDNDLYNNKIIKMKQNYEKLSKYEFVYSYEFNVSLNEIFEECKDLNLKLFFDFFCCLFFFQHINDFIVNRKVIINLVNQIKFIFEDINKCTEICISEKIRLINSLFLLNDKLEKITDLNSLKIKYYIISNSEKEQKENNILGKVVKFFEQYFEKINENSDVYENFMFLNGGYGYFNQHKVYTYDMSNLEMIKSNLKNIILPKIFIFCYIENEEISFSTPEFRSIIINEYNYALKYKNELNNVNIDYKNPELCFKIQK